MSQSAPQSMAKDKNKKAWLIPVLCLIAGGGLIGISTNLAKIAG